MIIARAHLWGPAGDTAIDLGLDTGAAFTILPPEALMDVGYDPRRATGRTRLVTVSGTEPAPLIALDRFAALGLLREHVLVVSHHLPAASPVRGLLGLDFFRGTRLTLDFRGGTIALE